LRRDYESLVETVKRVLATGETASVSVESRGDYLIKSLSIRAGKRPNRASVEIEDVIFSISPELQESFISFIDFPTDEDLPRSAVYYHHHFDSVWDDTGENIALDSVSVVFALLRD
jgi:hypothetical protein